MTSPNPLRQTTGRKSKISKPIAGGRRHLRAALGPNYRPSDGTADGACTLSMSGNVKNSDPSLIEPIVLP